MFPLTGSTDWCLGKTGVGDRIDRSSLVPVNFLLSGKIVMISAGATFSVAVTDKGQVYTWGSNANGQLGLGDLRDRLSPEPVTGKSCRFALSPYRITHQLEHSQSPTYIRELERISRETPFP